MVEKPLLLFDMDGTLIIIQEKPEYRGIATSYTPYVSLRQQMKDVAVFHGVPIGEYDGLNRMAHIWNRTRIYAESNDLSETQTELLMKAINEPFTQEESAEHAKSVLIPGTIETLESLQNDGYSIGIVTTASRRAYERISNNTEFGCFSKYFQHSITRDDCNYVKPDPEPINRILQLFGHSGFIYVGDSDHDAQAANAAGGTFVLMNTRKYDDRTINALNPKAVIHSLTELPNTLRKI